MSGWDSVPTAAIFLCDTYNNLGHLGDKGSEALLVCEWGTQLRALFWLFCGAGVELRPCASYKPHPPATGSS